MEAIDQLDVIVSNQLKAYLVKTCNGKYYQTYVEEKRIDDYKEPVRPNSLNEKAINRKHELLMAMKEGDLIVMGGYRHQKAMLGILVEGFPNLSVHWLREVNIEKLPWLYPFLYRNQSVVDVSTIVPKLIRYYYSYYQMDRNYHLVIEVNQQNPITLQSLYGLERLIYEATHEQPLTVKVHLESPGLLEFISKNKDIIQMVLKIILILIQFKTRKRFRKEHERLFQVYQRYEIETLNLTVNDPLTKLIDDKDD